MNIIGNISLWDLIATVAMVVVLCFSGWNIFWASKLLRDDSQVTKFASGGIVPGASYGAIPDTPDESEPLEETWSNEKVEAWRIIDVTVEKGDPDGLWLGFPHPDGPTADVVTPLRHPVGVELHAECRSSLPTLVPGPQIRLCNDVPGEHCPSGIGYGCGFYAYKTRGAAVTHAVAATHSPWGRGTNAVAKVLLSGKVIEHEDGYRAEILEVIEVEPPAPPDLSMGIEFSQAAHNLAAVGRSFPFIGPNIISGGT